MRTDAERFWDKPSAVTARLRCEVSRDSYDSSTGALSLVLEYLNKRGPARVRDAFRQTMVLEHPRNAQVLDEDASVVVGVLLRRLVQKILALTSYLQVLLGDAAGRLFPAIGVLLAAAQLPICSSELLLRFPVMARIRDRIPLRVGKKHLETNIETNGRFVVNNSRVIPQTTGDEYVPIAVGAKNKMRRPGRTFKGAMVFDLNVTPELSRDLEASCFGIKKHISPSAVLPKLYRVPAVSRFESGKPSPLAKLLACKISTQSFVQPVGERLNRRRRNMLAASSFETAHESVLKQKGASFLVMYLNLLKHLVVQVPGLYQARRKPFSLRTSRKESVFECLEHRTSCKVLGGAIHQPLGYDGLIVEVE